MKATDEHAWQTYQRQLAVCFAGTGYAVVEASTQASFAPYLSIEQGQRIVSPDLLLFGRHWAVPCMVDAKLKQLAPLYRNVGARTTGIDRDVYHRYRRVQDLSGQPVFIFFGHIDEDEVRAVWISQPTVAAAGEAADTMTYWDYDKECVYICSLADVFKGRPFADLVLVRSVQGALF